MSLYNGPPRGGARGGKDQFNWEEVKSDKFREYYLGASVKANVGRWQKDRDVFWYTREKGDQGTAIEDEVAAVKAREEDMMLEALGMKPKRRKPVEMKARLDANEMKSLLQRGGPEDEQEGEAAKPVVEEDEDTIRGIGFASAAMRAAPSALGDSSERMEGTGVLPSGGLPPPPPPPGDYRGAPGLPRSSAAGGAPASETLRSLEKLKRKAEKRAKREAKKAKKKKSKEKKKHKESKKSRHDSSDDDSDSGAEETGARRAQDGRDAERLNNGAPGLGHHSRSQEEEDQDHNRHRHHSRRQEEEQDRHRHHSRRQDEEQDRNRHRSRREEEEQDRNRHHSRRQEEEQDRNRHHSRRQEVEQDRNRHQHRRHEEEDRNRHQCRRHDSMDRDVPPQNERKGHRSRSRSRSRSPYSGRR